MASRRTRRERTGEPFDGSGPLRRHAPGYAYVPADWSPPTATAEPSERELRIAARNARRETPAAAPPPEGSTGHLGALCSLHIQFLLTGDLPRCTEHVTKWYSPWLGRYPDQRCFRHL